MKLSIIITTFNRADRLEQLLEDLTAQHKRLRRLDSSEVEIILIDNNSIDTTNEVAYRFMESTELSIKFYTEKKFGISTARNLAISKANGDLLAFIHDDIQLDDDWLKETFKVAEECQDHEIGVYGGRVVPMWQDSLPKWLSLEAPFGIKQDVFTGHSFGEDAEFYPFETDFGLVTSPSGANVMIRKEVFENCGDFREDLGASAAGGLNIHEDAEFFDYLTTLKIPICYTPQVVVYHPVENKELDIKNIRRWYYKSARAKYWIAHTDRMKRNPGELYGIPSRLHGLFPEFTKKRIGSVPSYLYIKFVFLSLWYLLSFLSFNKKKRNWISFMVSETVGEIEASGLVQEYLSERKFSFKDKLIKKGLIEATT